MDFDVQRRERQDKLAEEFGDHSFTLGGEQFQIRRIIPFAALAKLTGVTREGSTDADAFQAVQEVVLSMLAGGQDARDRFLNVIYDATAEYPVTYIEMLEVQNWMVEEASGRPPTQPESSSGSSSTNGTNGTENSSSEPAGA